MYMANPETQQVVGPPSKPSTWKIVVAGLSVTLVVVLTVILVTKPNVTSLMTVDDAPVKRPALPPNPMFGGEPKIEGAILYLATNLLVNHVEQGCWEAEKKPSDRLFSDVVFPMNDGQLIISQLRLTSLTLPISLTESQRQSDLCWGTKKGRFSATGLWTYRQTIANNTVNSTGFVNIPETLPRTIFSAQLNTTLGRNSNYQPAVTKIACFVGLDKSKIDFSSPNDQALSTLSSAIVGLKSNLIEKIENVLVSSMCDLISNVLQTSFNKFFSTFQTKIQLWNEPKITLDYSLLTDPLVEPTFSSINIYLNGTIYVNGANVLSIYPHEMDFPTNYAEKSITTRFSDYMLNSMLISAYQANALQLITINDSYSHVVANYLKMDCESDELCVGSVFPSSNYQTDSYAEISLAINQVPSAVFLESGAFLQLTGNLLLDIKTIDPYTTINQYQSSYSLVAAMTPHIRSDESNHVIFMEAELEELLLDTDAPLFSRDSVRPLIASIMEEIINKPLRQGIPMPMFVNNEIIHHCKAEFTFLKRTLLLSQIY